MENNNLVSQNNFACRSLLLWDFLASCALFLCMLAVYL